MKRTALLSLIATLFLVACTYDAPLAPFSSLPIDESLLGTWEMLSDDGATPSGETAVVSEGGDGRYRIEYRDGDSVIFFDAWPGQLAGLSFLQLEATGDDEGPVTAEDSDLYTVVAWEFSGEELVVRALNTDLVDENLSSTAELQKAFHQHRDNPDLFVEPGRMRRL